MRPVSTLELELLLLCARVRLDAAQVRRIDELLGRTINWNGLILLARRHGIACLLHRTLAGLNARRMPVEVMGRLRSVADAFRFRNILYVRELHTAVQAIEAAGIPVAPYKGPALAASLYGDFALREMTDIDLLVKPRDAIKARRALSALGYTASRQVSRWLEPAWVFFHCEFAFASRSRLSVELNWRVATRYWCLPEVPERAWARMRPLNLGGVELKGFRPEDLLLILCLHGSKHKWDTLKWVVDIAELFRTHPDLDWREALYLARASKCERMLALGLFLAHELLDAPLPADLAETIRAMPSIARLAEDVCKNLHDARAKPADSLTELAFLGRLTDRSNAKLVYLLLRPLYFMLHRIVRPAISFLRGAGADRITARQIGRR